MRFPTTAGTALMAIVVVTASGCNQAQFDKAIGPVGERIAESIAESGHEMVREAILREWGPMIVTSVVFASAPPGGPALIIDSLFGRRLADDDRGTRLDESACSVCA